MKTKNHPCHHSFCCTRAKKGEWGGRGRGKKFQKKLWFFKMEIKKISVRNETFLAILESSHLKQNKNVKNNIFQWNFFSLNPIFLVECLSGDILPAILVWHRLAHSFVFWTPAKHVPEQLNRSQTDKNHTCHSHLCSNHAAGAKVPLFTCYAPSPPSPWDRGRHGKRPHKRWKFPEWGVTDDRGL